MTFEMIKRNFDRGLWNKQMVGMAVKKGIISAAQYQEITGEVYSEEPTPEEQLAAVEAAMREGVNSTNE